MKHVQLGRVLTVTFLTVAFGAGCQASASARMGGGTTPTAAPPGDHNTDAVRRATQAHGPGRPG